MSMELYALSQRRLNSIAEWQAAVDRHAWRLTLNQETVFERLKGFLPVTWEGERTGFECDHLSRDDIANLLKDEKFDPELKYVLAFRWGSLDECVAAVHACAAYAFATNGLVFDCEQGKLISPQEAADQATQVAQFLPGAKRLLQEQLERIKSRK